LFFIQPASARGSGIRVISKWAQIPKKMPVVVQRYIDNPYLINETKFDLRLYILITSINPLRLYLYDNGLVRFASGIAIFVIYLLVLFTYMIESIIYLFIIFQ